MKPHVSPSAPRLVELVAVCVGSLAILFFRSADAFRAPQFYHEDALIFWAQQYGNGFLGSFFEPYAGYLHAVPRLIAGGAALFSYVHQPAAYLVGAVAVTMWTVATVMVTVRPPWLGAVFGISIVLVPHPGEVWATPTNAQWIMATALPVLAVFASPVSTWARCNQIAFLVLAGLSGPFSVLTAPLWGIRILCEKGRDRYVLLCALVGGVTAIVQVFYLLRVGSDIAGSGDGFAQALGILLRRWLSYPIMETTTDTIAIIVGAIVLGASAFGRLKFQRLALLGYGFAVLLAVGLKFKAEPLSLNSPWNGARYLYTPTVMLTFALATMLAEWRRWPIVMVVGALGIGFIDWTAANFDFVRRPLPDFSAEWAEKAPNIGLRPQTVHVAPNAAILSIPVR